MAEAKRAANPGALNDDSKFMAKTRQSVAKTRQASDSGVLDNAIMSDEPSQRDLYPFTNSSEGIGSSVEKGLPCCLIPLVDPVVHSNDNTREAALSNQFRDAASVDFSSLLAQGQVYRECLGWTENHIRIALLQRFGKASQTLLTDLELIEWIAWLNTQIASKE